MIVVTGGAGFIGINFVKLLLDNRWAQPHEILVIDKLTYASNESAVRKLGVNLAVVDIADKNELFAELSKHDVYGIINFAAESHVDRSIEDCTPFVYSNIIGTINLLEYIRSCEHWDTIRFLQVSTDEVFGQVLDGSFTEQSPLQPRNPYSASKASAEHFVNAYATTHKLNTVIVNCCNNYGPYQNEEKLIPKAISLIKQGEPVPLYGYGQQIREWIYVEDAVRAIYKILIKGKRGQKYCIGSGEELTNNQLVKFIGETLELDANIKYVEDRKGHDARYCIDSTKLRALGWHTKVSFQEGLKNTIEWMNK
jgi:dTDP-glucose 4,6-dehydratase